MKATFKLKKGAGRHASITNKACSDNIMAEEIKNNENKDLDADTKECDKSGSENEKSEKTVEGEGNKEVKAETSESSETEEKTDKKDKKELKKLKSELDTANKNLEESKKKLDEQNDKYLRLAAEYDNFRKRTQNERKNIYGDAVTDTLTGLLPIIDNLQYAAKYSSSDSEKLAEGLTLILSKLPETLDKLGIKPFGETGDTFDPALHNAVMHVEDDALGEGEIVEVFQQGYKYGEKVIRYATVKVAN